MTANRRRLQRLGVATAAAALLLTGCVPDQPEPSASAAPRAVTEDEAQVLAVVRFRNYDAGTRAVEAAYRDSGHEVRLNGYVDYATHTGYATVSIDGSARDLIVWDGAAVAISPDPPASAEPGPPPASAKGWTIGALESGRSALETVLAVLAALGADRPENPLLIEQSDALWLREDTIGGQAVTVFAGPSENPQATSGTADPDGSGIRYWVDETGLALRVEVRLGDEWATIDLGDAEDITVPRLPAAADDDGGDG
ncbi:hypothetical protein [Microbacterium sp. Marseille-Q6965]|uniref:hypothetical protein n=1 Tax=Microbacterium sp. Marseille-Q6965 TaxID=2965072 RepID=UPI0021B6EDBB|nr:hypothetical protein [Microbacterium sp. Marseille-Q6965]